jgi:hypothetical protein
VATVPEPTTGEPPVAETIESGAAPEVREREPEDEEAEDGTDERPDLAAQWGALMQDLRERRQAPAAAVYEEARVEGFDGAVLELAFPDELSIYVKLAQDARHADPLREAIAHRFGVNPRIECRVADGGSVGTAQDEPSRRADPTVEPAGAKNVGEDTQSKEAGAVNESDEISAESRGQASGKTGSNDIIRDQREVLEMARERFGSRDPNGGN